ncbi:MAG: cell division protein FtsZ [Bacteroidota bacterium]|jgi:cell division protein FtsZ|nr:cell division protein FtsZ [Bacteroidota bacterium]OQC34219.1 MAG: Cell division protein FtsZ [Bacteroidetes bacterium ADurb.Bin057]HHT60609.1 cell division protein FtsZ [Bacteroidales bacterium]HOA46710.1 cell division protein FtsZ [Paludibacteraceae bacterium]HOG37093.1 cell division protein FtsZ [Paludibacteraceae bacterium]
MGLVQFEMPKVSTSIIKVIGVGGGGSNAVNHMFREGITDVSFVVCNTDDQALKKSPVPIQIQLGVNITEGLGAGSKPEVAREAAIESLPEIEKMLSDNTKMAFITAGMGGGTGTGAAPVIAEAAKKLGILTVGIVTIPFAFEGKRKIMQALEGVRQMSKHVDAILIINNEKLREIYPDIELSNAFNIADNVLANAAKGIAEIITVDGYINVDFADVYTIMKNGGVAVMNTGRATGEKRITKAIENALDSPLLDNRNVHEAKKILLSLYCSTTNKIVMEEVSEINEFMDKMGEDIEVIWGVTFDEDLGDDVKITLIATGFGNDSILEEMMKEDELDDDEEPYDETSATVNQIQQDTKTKWMKHLYPSKTDGSQLTISLDDMDDDDIFKEMENIPAYKRNNK